MLRPQVIPLLNTTSSSTSSNGNFFKKFSVSSFSFNKTADATISFVTNGVMFAVESTGIVEVSFDGVNVHLELDSSKITAGQTFDNRKVQSIWLRAKTGSISPITISINAWGNP